MENDQCESRISHISLLLWCTHTSFSLLVVTIIWRSKLAIHLDRLGRLPEEVMPVAVVVPKIWGSKMLAELELSVD